MQEWEESVDRKGSSSHREEVRMGKKPVTDESPQDYSLPDERIGGFTPTPPTYRPFGQESIDEIYDKRPP